MNIRNFARKIPARYQSASPAQSFCLWTKAQVTRNPAGFNFPSRCGKEEVSELAAALRAAFSQSRIFAKSSSTELPVSSTAHKNLLAERHLLANSAEEGRIRLLTDKDENFCALVGGDEHLRLACFMAGMEPEQTFSACSRKETLLGNFMDYAFSPDFGFLAANPLNAGTGLEMSCLLHLPAVDMAQKLPQTLGSLSYWKLGWKPAFGETLETSGGLCLVYTTQKFGLTQEETCAGLKSGAAMLEAAERNARETLFAQPNRAKTEDTLYRAKAILENARTMPEGEAFVYLSRLRMLITSGMEKTCPLALAQTLIARSAAAHLRLANPTIKTAADIDIFRADMIRTALSSPIPPAA